MRQDRRWVFLRSLIKKVIDECHSRVHASPGEYRLGIRLHRLRGQQGMNLAPLASLHRYSPIEIMQEYALTCRPFVLNWPKYDNSQSRKHDGKNLSLEGKDGLSPIQGRLPHGRTTEA